MALEMIREGFEVLTGSITRNGQGGKRLIVVFGCQPYFLKVGWVLDSSMLMLSTYLQRCW